MNKYQVFISYKRGTHSNVAENLYQSLTRRGYSVFWDRSSIERGELYNQIIQDAIKSARIFILLLSRDIVEAYAESQKEGKDGPYIKKEIDIAISHLKWVGAKRFSIYPYIIDDSSPEEYSATLSEFYDELNFGENVPVDSIPEDVYNKLKECQCAPDKVTETSYATSLETTERAGNIFPLVKSIIDECKTCPRFASSKERICCPFMNELVGISDRQFYESESAAKTGDNVSSFLERYPEPQRADYSNDEIDNERFCFEHERWEKEQSCCYVYPDEIRRDFDNLVGEGHSNASGQQPCTKQRDHIKCLEKSLQVFRNTVSQQILVGIQSQISDYEETSKDKQWERIQNKFDIPSYIKFLKQQIIRKWHLKIEVLETLAHENSCDSTEGLLAVSLEKTICALSTTIDNGTPIQNADNKYFIIIWWLLRDSSNMLLWYKLSKLPEAERREFYRLFEKFVELYKTIKTLGSYIIIDNAVPLYYFDYSDDDMDSRLFHFLGFKMDVYRWNSLLQWEESSYVCEVEMNKIGNPVPSEKKFGISRGVSRVSPRNSLDKSNELAVNYLYPIAQYCSKTLEFLKNGGNKLEQRLLGANSAIAFRTFDSSVPYAYNTEEWINYYHIYDYHCLLYQKTLMNPDICKERFSIALSDIETGNVQRGIKNLELLAEKQSIDAIVYLANLYENLPRPNLERAIYFYGIAAERGVEFCYRRLAECYEKSKDYKQAYRWYLLSEESSGHEAKSNLSLRKGVCAYHLGYINECVKYFNNAGILGQAAIYTYKLYGDYLESIMNDCAISDGANNSDFENEGYNHLLKALTEKIRQSETILGNFTDLHNITAGKCVIEREINLKEIATLAKENDAESQYTLGLLKMEEYISSDTFLKEALSWIRIAANNGNPDALCLLGSYYRNYRDNYDECDRLYRKAFEVIYPRPFPELL